MAILASATIPELAILLRGNSDRVEDVPVISKKIIGKIRLRLGLGIGLRLGLRFGLGLRLGLRLRLGLG